MRPDGRVVLVGYARDRFTLTPTLYGMRAVVALANGTAAAPNTNVNGCGTYHDRPNPDVPGAFLSLGSNGVAIDGLTDYLGTPSLTDPAAAQGGRFYEGVVALPNNTYVVDSTVGPDGASWVQRFTNTTGGAAGPGVLDATFNATGTVPGRTLVNGVNLHALALSRAPADGSVFAAGETTGATASTETMAVARIDTNGTIGGYGVNGVATSLVAGGADSGQALVVDATNTITVGGGANLAGKTAFGLTRFTPTGNVDATFGAGGSGETTTAIGNPAVNAYITGIGLTDRGQQLAPGPFIAVSGRVTDPSGLLSVAGRYVAKGDPAPPLPPAASTLSVDQITMTSARINGSVNTNGVASNWWIEYGTTAAYGSQTVAQPLAPGNDDIGEQTVLTGLGHRHGVPRAPGHPERRRHHGRQRRRVHHPRRAGPARQHAAARPAARRRPAAPPRPAARRPSRRRRRASCSASSRRSPGRSSTPHAAPCTPRGARCSSSTSLRRSPTTPSSRSRARPARSSATARSSS